METNLLGASLFVQKLTSLNPEKHDFIMLEKALTDYSCYLFTINDNGRQDSAKGFKEWLKTEI